MKELHLMWKLSEELTKYWCLPAGNKRETETGSAWNEGKLVKIIQSIGVGNENSLQIIKQSYAIET